MKGRFRRYATTEIMTLNYNSPIFWLEHLASNLWQYVKQTISVSFLSGNWDQRKELMDWIVPESMRFLPFKWLAKDNAWIVCQSLYYFFNEISVHRLFAASGQRHRFSHHTNESIIQTRARNSEVVIPRPLSTITKSNNHQWEKPLSYASKNNSFGRTWMLLPDVSQKNPCSTKCP